MNASQTSLKEHYENMYAQERDAHGIDIIKDSAFPSGRLEACVHYFPKFWQGGDLLEISAGNGRLALSLMASGLEFKSYTATEYSDARLQGLKNNLDDSRFHLMHLAAEEIPDDMMGQYDAVIMVSLIEHLVDPIGVMQQIRELLRPGGFVYLDTANFTKYSRRLRLLFGRFPSTGANQEGLETFDGKPVTLYDEGHLHYFTFRSLSKMLTEYCGFTGTEHLAYSYSGNLFSRIIRHSFAVVRPQLFSELAMVATV